MMSVNDAYDYFMNKLNSSIDTYAPLKKCRISSKFIKREAWLTKGLLISIKRKQKLFRITRGKPKDHESVKFYELYKSMFNKIKRKAKVLYTNQFLWCHRNNTKKIWDFINKQVGKTHNKQTCTSILNSNNEMITDKKELSEQFCSFFANVGKNQATEIGSTKNIVSDYFKKINNNNSIFMHPTDESEILQTINKLKSKKSTGYDNISSINLKKIVSGIVRPLITN